MYDRPFILELLIAALLTWSAAPMTQNLKDQFFLPLGESWQYSRRRCYRRYCTYESHLFYRFYT